MRHYIIEETYAHYNEEAEMHTEAWEVAELIAEDIDEELYDEMLNDCYPEVEIMGMAYDPSVALYRLDPIAYRCGFDDYKDSIARDIEHELENMDDGDEEEFYGYTVRCVEM